MSANENVLTTIEIETLPGKVETIFLGKQEKISSAKDSTAEIQTRAQTLANISNTTKAEELKRIVTVLRLTRNPGDPKAIAALRDQQANDFIESRGFRSGRR